MNYKLNKLLSGIMNYATTTFLASGFSFGARICKLYDVACDSVFVSRGDLAGVERDAACVHILFSK